jgi:hypothetical protein
MPVNAPTGKYIITVTDETGNEIRRKVEIVSDF